MGTLTIPANRQYLHMDLRRGRSMLYIRSTKEQWRLKRDLGELDCMLAGADAVRLRIGCGNGYAAENTISIFIIAAQTSPHHYIRFHSFGRFASFTIFRIIARSSLPKGLSLIRNAVFLSFVITAIRGMDNVRPRFFH